MKKLIAVVLMLVCLAGNCAADDVSDQIKATLRALEKVNSRTSGILYNGPEKFLEAAEEAEVEAKLLIKMDKSKCSELLFQSSFVYRTAALFLQADQLSEFMKNAQEASDLLTKAYKACLPKRNK